MEFKHPEFLWGFLLLLIPLAVHLLQFRKRKKILFPGVSRLLAALLVSQKQRNIRFWLLLTLRTLFFGILVLAFAEPYFPQNTPSSNNRWIIIYDNSPSMFLKDDEGENAHQEAQNVLQSWLKTISANQSFALVTSGSSDGWLDANQLRVSLGEISENSRPRRFKEMMRKSQQWILRAKDDGFSPKILVVSDFQSDFLEVDPSIDFLKSGRFLKVGRQNLKDDEFNLSLDTVYFNKDRSGILAQITLHSKKPIQLLTNVSLWTNGVIKAQKQVQFEEKKSPETTEFESQFKTVEFNLSGLKLDSFRVQIQGDQFKADNELFCQFSSSRRQKIFIDPAFQGYNEIQKVFQVQSERFELIQNEQESDWLVQQLSIDQVNKYQGDSRRMIFLKNEPPKLNSTNAQSRMAPEFLDLPLFEGLLTSQLDDKTPLPEFVVNTQWSGQLSNDFDAVIQTESNQTVLFKNDQSDRVDFIWAGSWNEGMAKFRQSVWFLPVFSQLIFGSSPSNNHLYTIQNGSVILDPKLNASIDKTLNVSSTQDSTRLFLANIQNGSQGLELPLDVEIQKSGFYKIEGDGFRQSFAFNVKNQEFKNNSGINSNGNMKFYEDQGVEFIQTEADLLTNEANADFLDWSKFLLYAAFVLILIESVVLYNMFRTKIVNSQKQA